MEFNELERQILLHRRSRQKEVLVLAAVAAAVIGGVALLGLVLARAF